jgi:hypothetical protein
VTEQTKWGLGGLTVGLVTGALIMTAVVREEEDRPPMVVRGGSLIFQNGIPNSVPSKKCKKNGNDWEMDHPNGKPTNYFIVAVVGSGTCGLAVVNSIALEYRLNGGGTKVYSIELKGPGNKIPMIVGENLAPVQGDETTLNVTDAGTLIRVTAGSISCQPMSNQPIYVLPLK